MKSRLLPLVWNHFLSFKKSLDTYEPPTIPDQKKAAHFNTNSLWQSNNLSDNTRRRPIPTTIGGSKTYLLLNRKTYRCFSFIQI
jgi:hypothetical protein